MHLVSPTLVIYQPRIDKDVRGNTLSPYGIGCCAVSELGFGAAPVLPDGLLILGGWHPNPNPNPNPNPYAVDPQDCTDGKWN